MSLIFTDGRITLASLKMEEPQISHRKNRKNAIEIQNVDSKMQFNWIKAQAGHHGNDLADQTSKEAATNIDNER